MRPAKRWCDTGTVLAEGSVGQTKMASELKDWSND